MQKDIREWYGARTVERQAVTAPGPQPQRGPPSATGARMRRNEGEIDLEVSNGNLEKDIPLVLAH